MLTSHELRYEGHTRVHLYKLYLSVISLQFLLFKSASLRPAWISHPPLRLDVNNCQPAVEHADQSDFLRRSANFISSKRPGDLSLPALPNVPCVFHPERSLTR